MTKNPTFVSDKRTDNPQSTAQELVKLLTEKGSGITMIGSREASIIIHFDDGSDLMLDYDGYYAGKLVDDKDLN